MMMSDDNMSLSIKSIRKLRSVWWNKPKRTENLKEEPIVS